MSVSASRRNGDYYQDLYGWYRTLELLKGRPLAATVTMEADNAGHVDDVVVTPGADAGLQPVEYVQLKFHVGLTRAYSIKEMTRQEGTKKSLLQKFWVTWQRLRDRGHPFTLTLLSTWAWDPTDPLGRYITGRSHALREEVFADVAPKAVREALMVWRQHLEPLGATQSDFEAFLRVLRLRVAYNCMDDLEKLVRERMDNRQLAQDDGALLKGTGLVAEWIRSGRVEVTSEFVRAELRRVELFAPEAEPAVRICLHTIERQVYDDPPEHVFDWCDGFEGDFTKGHRVKDPTLWNERFLPELQAVKREINGQPTRLIRARGQARLSAWFAFAHVFDNRARYVIEVDQNGQRWRTDAPPSDNLEVVALDDSPHAHGGEVAVAVSISQLVDEDVRDAILELGIPAASTLYLRPARGVGRGVIGGAGDLTAFVEQCRGQIASFVRRHRARRVHLFYCGPLSGAAFLAHALGAAAPEVQFYEDQRPGYAPSFLLTA